MWLGRIDAAFDKLFSLARSAAAPTRSARLRAAVAIASVAALFPYIRYLHDPTHPADFGLAWFGAHALLNGADPYVLIGPGKVYDWPWPLIYPATAMVAVFPLAWMPQLAATITFVWISTCLLAYHVTRAGWFRLLMFFTPAFVIAAGAAQWSPLLTASLFMPVVGYFFAAKPNIGLALAFCGSMKLRRNALVGGVLLTAISLALLPSWPAEWIHSARNAQYAGPPLGRLGGFVILLVLLRWRRPEAWLVAVLAAVPQTTYWYEVLPLFLVPASLGEMVALAAACSLGILGEKMLLTTTDNVIFNRQVGALLVAFVYLPATVMILRRPNIKAAAPWSDPPNPRIVPEPAPS